MSQIVFHRITERDLLRLDACCKAAAAAALFVLPRALFALGVGAPVSLLVSRFRSVLLFCAYFVFYVDKLHLQHATGFPVGPLQMYGPADLFERQFGAVDGSGAHV